MRGLSGIFPYDCGERSIRLHDAPSANLDLAHHVATDIEPVEVIGRVYDFHITDIADYNWETVFRKQKGNAVPSGASYWTGLRDIDGGTRGNSLPYTLPIAPGKHPTQGYKNAP